MFRCEQYQKCSLYYAGVNKERFILSDIGKTAADGEDRTGKLLLRL